MSWLNTLFDVTNVALNVANYNKLEQLKNEGAASQMIQAVLLVLREEIFKFKQTAEEILANEAQSPKIAAAATRLLEARLDESPVSPDLFVELSDKDYVASTIRLIHTESRRLMSGLSVDEAAEVEDILVTSSELEDSSYYVENYQKAHRLIGAHTTVKELGWRNSPSSTWGVGCSLTFVLFFLFYLIGSSLSGNSMFGLVLLVIIGGGAFLGFVYWQGRGRYNKAKIIVEKYEDEIDLNRFKKLNRQYHRNPKRASAVREQANAKMDAFFAGESIPAPLPSTVVLSADALEDPKIVDIPTDGMAPVSIPDPQHEELKVFDNAGSAVLNDDADEKISQSEEFHQSNDSSTSSTTLEIADDSQQNVKPEDPITNSSHLIHRFCMNCGGEHKQKARFCPHCGKPINH